MNERRACRVIGADRKSMRYRSQRDDDADLRSKLRELAQQRRRFGYRLLHILLRRVIVSDNVLGREASAGKSQRVSLRRWRSALMVF